MTAPPIRIAGFAVLLLLVLPGSATATHVQCGDTITQDTTLDSNVVCVDDGPGGIPDDAIIIGADNITLDLNGYNARGSCWEFGSGVLNIGHHGVAIENGAFGSNQSTQGSGFHGVRLVDAADNTLRNLSATTCVEGPGFSLLRSNGNRIVDVAATTYRGSGISLQQSDDNLIRGSTFAGNNTGIALGQSVGNQIEKNSLHNVVGVSLFESDQNRLNENSVIGAADHRCQCAFGIRLGRSNANLLRNNIISQSTASEGLEISDSDDNRITHNYLTDNGAPVPSWELPGRDGLLVDSTSDRTELKHNTVLRSGNDGIDVRNAATRLVANRANENDDLGIEAVPGVNGHGNHAFGNGNPLQCLNIECK